MGDSPSATPEPCGVAAAKAAPPDECIEHIELKRRPAEPPARVAKAKAPPVALRGAKDEARSPRAPPAREPARSAGKLLFVRMPAREDAAGRTIIVTGEDEMTVLNVKEKARTAGSAL